MSQVVSQFVRSTLPTPLALLEVEVKGVTREAVELPKPALRERPEGFDAVDVDAVPFREFVVPVVHPEVPVVADVNEPVVPAPAVRVDDGIERNTSQNQGLERPFLAVGHNLREHLARSLEDAEDGLLHRSAASLELSVEAAPPLRAVVGLIHLHLAAHELPAALGAPPKDGEAEAGEEPVRGLAVYARERRRSRRVDVEAKTRHQLGNFAMVNPCPLYNAHMTILPCG